MACVGQGHYVVTLLHVGSPNGSSVKLVLQCEPRTGKIWFHAGSVLPNEEHVVADFRKRFEKIGLLMIHDLTVLRVPLPDNKIDAIRLRLRYLCINPLHNQSLLDAV
jgi:hypothetical protein